MPLTKTESVTAKKLFSLELSQYSKTDRDFIPAMETSGAGGIS